MAGGLKIAVIGGGSSYTPELVEGLIRYRATLPVRELWLVDIDKGREQLEIVGALAAAARDATVRHIQRSMQQFLASFKES